jgi:hypothetical protein
MEALWEAGEYSGRRLEVPDQVAVARELSGRGVASVTSEDVAAVFGRLGLSAPSPTCARAIAKRVRNLRPSPTLRDLLLDYRQFAIRELSGQFGGKTHGREEELRNNLLTFLPRRGFTEARSGRGRTDIVLPAPPSLRVVETKVWGGRRLYEDGLEELSRYINTEKPSEAYLVIFGDREPLPSIVADHHQAIAEERVLEGLRVPVIVVPFEVDQPSKAAARARGRTRCGR